MNFRGQWSPSVFYSAQRRRQLRRLNLPRPRLRLQPAARPKRASLDRHRPGRQPGPHRPGRRTPPPSPLAPSARLPAGSSATVSNSGTTQNAILNFGIPQGATGPRRLRRRPSHHLRQLRRDVPPHQLQQHLLRAQLAQRRPPPKATPSSPGSRRPAPPPSST